MIRKKCQRKGFTILEAMVSVSILAMASMAVMSLTAVSAKIQRQSESSAAALNIARTQIENLTSVSQANRVAVSDVALPISTKMASMMPSGTSNVSATYSIVAVSGTVNLQEIRVRVRWKNAMAGTGGAAWSAVSVSKYVVSTSNLNGALTTGWTPVPIDQLFYTPPPPPPPAPYVPPTPAPTTTGSTSGSTSGSSGGSSSSSSTSGTTASPPPATGFDPTSGSKWK